MDCDDPPCEGEDDYYSFDASFMIQGILENGAEWYEENFGSFWSDVMEDIQKGKYYVTGEEPIDEDGNHFTVLYVDEDPTYIESNISSFQIDEIVRGEGGGQLVNPTGNGIRNDDGGEGHYGASRGNRKHYGIDLSSIDGQKIYSPVSGSAINSSYVNGKGITVPTVVIIPEDKTLEFDKLELLYVGPVLGQWRKINAGDVVGESINLQGLGYPSNVGPHIHLQMKLNGSPVDPTNFFKF